MGGYRVNGEIDDVAWVPSTRPRHGSPTRYDQRDPAGGARDQWRTRALVVLRHGPARSRKAWRKRRPAAARCWPPGGCRPQRLAPLLAAYGATRLVTSSSLRCVQTLAPYAEVSGWPLEPTDGAQRGGCHGRVGRRDPRRPARATRSARCSARTGRCCRRPRHPGHRRPTGWRPGELWSSTTARARSRRSSATETVHRRPGLGHVTRVSPRPDGRPTVSPRSPGVHHRPRIRTPLAAYVQVEVSSNVTTRIQETEVNALPSAAARPGGGRPRPSALGPACGAGNEADSGSASGGDASALNGGGATSQAKAQGVWRADYQEATRRHHQLRGGRLRAPGVENFTSKAYSFAGTDAYLDDDEGELTAAKDACGERRDRGAGLRQPHRGGLQPARHRLAEPRRRDDRRTSSTARSPSGTTRRSPPQNPASKLPEHRDLDRPPLRRVGHDEQLHRLPQQGQRRRLDGRAPTPCGRPASRAARASRAPRASSVALTDTEGAIGYADDSRGQGRRTSAWCRSRSARATTPRRAEGAAQVAGGLAAGADGRADVDMATDIDRTATGQGRLPADAGVVPLACQTYSDAGDRRHGEGLPGLRRLERGPAGRGRRRRLGAARRRRCRRRPTAIVVARSRRQLTDHGGYDGGPRPGRRTRLHRQGAPVTATVSPERAGPEPAAAPAAGAVTACSRASPAPPALTILVALVGGLRVPGGRGLGRA